MSIKKSTTWWSHRSLAQTMINKTVTFSESCKLIKRESIAPQDKHTFFPGNEIARNRIQNTSRFIITADSRLKNAFDFLIFIVTIFLSFFVPYSISYFSDLPRAIYIIISSFFILDILIGFNSSFFYKGTMITNRREIAKNYIVTWLVWDLLAAFPSEVFVQLDYKYNKPIAFDYDRDFLRVFLLLKLAKLGKIKKFANRISDLSTGSAYYTGTKVVIFFLGIVIPMHWMNCIFNMFYAGQLESNYVYWRNVRYENIDRYLIIFQRIVQTLTSVGYGDFVVQTTNERIIIVIFMLFTSGSLMFFVGQIEITIIHSSTTSIFFGRVRTKLLAYYEKHKIPRAIRSKVNAYIRHLRFSYNSNMVQDEDIIKILSIPLREQIFLCTKGYILIAIPFFSSLSRPCIRAFGYKMTLQVYGPSDLIFSQGEVTANVFFISSGSVQIFHAESKTIFIELHKEMVFGELSFLLIQSRSASARSSSFSELFSLNRYECDKILMTMPKDKEKFYILIRNLKAYGNSVIDLKCYLCGSFDHIARNCAFFIIKPNLRKMAEMPRSRRINVEYTNNKRNMKNERVANTVRYNVQNTKGRQLHPIILYDNNKYLARKSIEHFNYIDVHDRKYARFMSLMDDRSNDRSYDSSSDSERNYMKFKCFDKKNVEYGVNLKAGQNMLSDAPMLDFKYCNNN